MTLKRRSGLPGCGCHACAAPCWMATSPALRVVCAPSSSSRTTSPSRTKTISIESVLCFSEASGSTRGSKSGSLATTSRRAISMSMSLPTGRADGSREVRAIRMPQGEVNHVRGSSAAPGTGGTTSVPHMGLNVHPGNNANVSSGSSSSCVTTARSAPVRPVITRRATFLPCRLTIGSV